MPKSENQVPKTDRKRSDSVLDFKVRKIGVVGVLILAFFRKVTKQIKPTG